MFVRGPRLYLGKDNGVVIERDEVDLSDRARVISRKNTVPASAQVTRRDPLAARAEQQVVRRVRRRLSGAASASR